MDVFACDGRRTCSLIMYADEQSADAAAERATTRSAASRSDSVCLAEVFEVMAQA